MRSKLLFISSLFVAISSSGAINLEVPDKEGATIKGMVYCGDTPLKDVQVSDGVTVTLTDAEGRYYLSSDKRTGFVFICNPKGYVVPTMENNPLFYKAVNTRQPNLREQKNFELLPDPYDNQTIMFLADIQMCGRNADIRQFEENAMPDLNETVAEKKSENRGVYLITLGDQTYDHYWASYGFGIPESKALLSSLKGDAIYQCMGNHDHDPSVRNDDWSAGLMFRENWGPTYYSLNIGNAHVVVLDNIVYKNPDGSRSYDCDIPDDMFKWMRRDLAGVSKDTPLLICMHAPLLLRPQCSAPDTPDPISFRYDFGTKFYNSVKDFSTVRVFSGHAHTNYSAQKYNMLEYNVGAVCGALWWPGYFVDWNSVCTDGSPAGYRVLDFTDGKMTSYYKSIGFNKDLQFRAYDLNNCYLTADRFAPSLSDKSLFDDWLANGGYGFDSSDYYSDGTPRKPNRILINVFAYDPRWTVEVFEDGTPIKVSRISGYDPYAMISDGAQRFDNTGHNSSGNPTRNSHLFMVQASSATSTINIRVTDPFGNVYIENMTRPKPFNIQQYMNENGISAINAVSEDSNDNSAIKYYDLMGNQISRPDKGIAIVRQGSSVRKMIF